MSKILYAIFRNKNISDTIRQKVEKICNELNPDNINPAPTRLYSSENVVFGISNPTSYFAHQGENVLLGHLFQKDHEWQHLNTENPDGNYAIFRKDGDSLEVLTDCMSTRTIWYYFDNDKLVASSSQKAIIFFLGNFEFDDRVIPWMLSSGSLGPTFSWDKRLKRVPTDGKVILNLKKWSIETEASHVEFHTKRCSYPEYKNTLEKSLEKTFRNLNVQLNSTVITLSGGLDSRALLLLFKKFGGLRNQRIKTLTWGKKTSLAKKNSDAYIAKQLAAKEDTNHKYLITEISSDEPLETIIDRFLHNGDGRIDHIKSYLDGFYIWKRVYEEQIEAVIRGDEVFGYSKALSPLVVNSFIGLTTCSDYSNLKQYDYITALEQEIPKVLQKGKDERLATWRDRIYNIYRVPFIQSAIADLKYPYVEQITPFLSREIVVNVRELPDKLRTDKKLFREIVREIDSGFPFSEPDLEGSFKKVLLYNENFVKLIKNELSSNYARQIFPASFLDKVISQLKTVIKEKKQFNPVSEIKKYIPKKVRWYLAQKNPFLYLDENRLAFRIYIIIKMHRTLNKSVN